MLEVSIYYFSHVAPIALKIALIFLCEMIQRSFLVQSRFLSDLKGPHCPHAKNLKIQGMMYLLWKLVIFKY